MARRRPAAAAAAAAAGGQIQVQIRLALSCQLLLLLCMLGMRSGSAAQTPASKAFVVRYRARNQLHQLVMSNDADKDVFKLLTDTQRSTWGGEGGRNLSALKAQFLSLPTQVLVEVKLVGFDNDSGGDRAISLPSDEVLRHLSSLSQDLHSVVLQPAAKHLAIKPSVVFEVTHSNRGLTERINLQLKRAAQAEKGRTGRQHHEALQLNYLAMDQNIAEDAAAARGVTTSVGREGVAALTLYLVNTESPGDRHEEHLYSYEQPGEEKPAETLSCPGTLFVSSTQPAYTWVDVGAGPTSYGPGVGHRGQVHAHTLPHPLHYKKHLLSRAMAPDLAALAWSATRHLAWPPLLHLHVSSKPKVLLHFVHMHDTLGPPPDRLDQDAIARMVQGVLKDMQEVEVQEIWLPFAHCDICVSIYSSALKVRTARQEGDLYMQAHTSRVLDRLTLHQGLQEHQSSIMTGFPLYGMNQYVQETQHQHILPIFVFDISDGGDEGLLIDGLVKATAFSDMVIAVSSRARHVPSHFKCRWNHAQPSAGNVTREVLAAILSSGWGVADTATFYSESSGEGEDYRWSVGNTAFGPLSFTVTINAAQAQAMRRNLVMSHLEDSISRITRLLDAFSSVSKTGRLDKSLTFEHWASIFQRLNMAHFKLSEAVRLLGQWQAPAALKMARSLHHDVDALERMGRSVSVKWQGGAVRCEGAASLWGVWWAPAGALGVCALAMWVRPRLYPSAKLEKLY